MSLLSMVLAITVYSLNVSQSVSSQRQIDRIKAEQLVLGQHWRNYMSLLNGNGIAPDMTQPFPEDHAGRIFSKNLTAQMVTFPPPGPGPGALSTTTQYEFKVDY